MAEALPKESRGWTTDADALALDARQIGDAEGERNPMQRKVNEEWATFVKAAQEQHGMLLNPITGEEVDIMQQCVNLQLDTGDAKEVGDKEAYKEVVANFAERLTQGTVAWADIDGAYKKGIVSRVNAEDQSAVTYDFQYTVRATERGREVQKAIICKDLTRLQLKTQPVLVLGDPAGGKTTFAKQLLIWVVRNDVARWLVPVMIRVIDLLRNIDSFVDDGRDMVDQHLRRRHANDGLYSLFRRARDEGRLLLILDGFDEAGIIHDRLVSDIQSRLYNDVSLVLTSRGMGTIFEQKEFHRFRRVRVKELNEDQQRQIYEKRLGCSEQADAFRMQLSLNPALRNMVKNPLLLNVTIAVFTSSDLGGSEGISRGKVYSMALDGMLGNIEKTKMTQLAGSASSGADGMKNISAKALRAVLRRLAFLAHTHAEGNGIRDFKRELAERAIRESQVGHAFTLDHWKEMEELIKIGRLPVLAWFEERGEDMFRFAHLTFQEFLCAEQCLEECLDDESFVGRWRDFVCPQTPFQVIEREWWQQCIQMFCDLANSTEACTAAGERLSTTVGEAFFRLDENPALLMPQGVKDSNILTLASMLQGSSVLRSLALGRPISTDGMSAFELLRLTSLRSLILKGNDIGPQGVKSLAVFLEKGSPSLEVLDLMNNTICQGAPNLDLKSVRTHRSCPRGFSYLCYKTDLSGLQALLEVARRHPSLRELDLRSNFLTREAGLMISEVMLENQNFRDVCGIPVQDLRSGRVKQLRYNNSDSFIYGGCPFLGTGGMEVLFELLLRFPQPGLEELCLASQAPASDFEGVLLVYEKIGRVVAAAESLQILDLTGFWECGAAAGRVLGRAIREHPSLKTLKIGCGQLDLAKMRDDEFPDGLLNMNGNCIRDCGAGVLSECLPPSVSKLHVRNTGLGASGFEMLSQCGQLQEINGLSLSAFTKECTELDLSGTRDAGAVACLISRIQRTCKLQKLNFCDSTLTSKSHVHRLIPIHSSGVCDGGCGMGFMGSDAAMRCCECDLDFCSTCIMSRCPMVALAETLDRLPHLSWLNISNGNWKGNMGRSGLDVDSYKCLGASLSKHTSLTHLDISRNHFRGPGFPYLASGIAQMSALSTIKLGANTIDFKRWLVDDIITAPRDWDFAELLLFAMAVARNKNLRRLDLSRSQKLSHPVIEALAQSLEASGDGFRQEEDGGDEAAANTRRTPWVALEVLEIQDVEIPFLKIQEGTLSTLDFSKDEVTKREMLAPLFDLMLRSSRSLVEVDFSNLDFGSATMTLADTILLLGKRDHPLRRCSNITLQPDPACSELTMSKTCRAMALGVHILAAAVVPVARLAALDLSGCGMDPESLGELLGAMTLRPTVTSLDVSNQKLEGAGVLALARFLKVDKKLHSLLACRIGMPPAQESLEFAAALETNTTLVHLDLRGNRLDNEVVTQIKRTIEELRRVLPLPWDAKVCFLLCNRMLPWNQQLPEVQDWDRGHVTGVSPSPIISIFQYCAQARRLLVDSGDGQWELHRDASDQWASEDEASPYSSMSGYSSD